MSKFNAVQCLDIYLEDLERRNYSKATIKGYRHSIKNFIRYLSIRDLSLHDTELKDILDYHTEVKQKTNKIGKPVSINYKTSLMRDLRLFFRYLKRKRLILIDPTEGLPQMKTQKVLPKGVMSKDEIDLLLAAPKVNTLYGFRDRTIMEVAYSTGLRTAECARLTIHDIDFKEGILRVNQGKGKKDRVVPIGEVAMNHVKEYLEKIRPKLNRKNNPYALFLAASGEPLNRNRVSAVVSKYLKKLKMRPELSFYAFRRTCGTEMLRGGSSIRYVQEMLGHEHINTTELYVKVLPMELKEIHDKAHPRARIKTGDFPIFEPEKLRGGEAVFFRKS